MKRIILSLIVCCGLFSLVTAQKTIEIDFSKKTAPKIPCKIRIGEFYQIKIKEINLNLYKVLLTSVDTILSKPQQTPTFGNFNLDVLSKVIAGISPLSISIPEPVGQNLAPKDNISMKMKQKNDALIQVKDSIVQILTRIDSIKLEVYKIRLNSLKLSNPSSNYNFTKALMEIEKIRNDIPILIKYITDKKNCYEAFAIANKASIAKQTE